MALTPDQIREVLGELSTELHARIRKYGNEKKDFGSDCAIVASYFIASTFLSVCQAPPQGVTLREFFIEGCLCAYDQLAEGNSETDKVH